MKSAELFPTICGHHWLPVFKNRPRRNKLSEQIRKHCGEAENQQGFDRRSLARPVGDNSASRTTFNNTRRTNE